jgi:hypothetical protein
MISTNRLLVLLGVLIVVAAAGRIGSLARYERTAALRFDDSGSPSDLRQLLFLAPDHRVDHFVAVPDLARPSDEIRPLSYKLAWLAIDNEPGNRHGASVRATAILRSDSDDPFAVDITSLLPDTFEEAILTLTPKWLEDLRFSTLAKLPAHLLDSIEIRLSVWDPDAPVYISAGPDGAPGIARHDDNGNGEVDDLSELGATGSDDFAVAPAQPGYEAAKSGQTLSRLISRGAIVPATTGNPIVLTDPTELWLDFDPRDSSRHRRIMLRLR